MCDGIIISTIVICTVILPDSCPLTACCLFSWSYVHYAAAVNLELHCVICHSPSPTKSLSDWLRTQQFIRWLAVESSPLLSTETNMAAPVRSMAGSSSIGNTTSFQKKSRSKLVSIPGTRPSVQNGQLLLSSGVSSLDYVIG